mmetsp:Transcript_25578/g.29303  ORF Transcript_25578/g.29303 Transcript_25578/m.29303 type:complete len:99 (-) Transcript_25578:245-541(-)
MAQVERDEAKVSDDPPANASQSFFSTIKGMMQNNIVDTAQENGMDTMNVENIDNALTLTAINLIGNPDIVSDVQARNDLQQQFPRTITRKNGMSITAV